MKIILLMIVSAISIFALEFDSIENTETLEKVNFFKEKTEVKNFLVAPRYIKMFNNINSELKLGDIKHAEKLAIEFYNETNVLSFKDNIVKNMANIALGNVYYTKGEKIKWKYMHLPTLEYVLKQDTNNLGSNYFFFIINLTPIILETKNKKETLELIKYTSRQLTKFREHFNKKTLEYLYYSLKHMQYDYTIKFSRKLRKEKEAFEEADKRLKRLYTYMSIEEARILFSRAKFYLNIIGDSELAFKPLKESYNITKTILEKKNPELLNNSVLLGNIYFELGKLFSTGTKLNKSIEYYNKSEQIFKNVEIYSKALDCKAKKAIVFKILKQFTKALEENKNQLELAKKEFGIDSEEYSVALVVKSDILSTMDKNEEALKYMEEAKDILIKKYGKFSKEVKIINSSLNFIKLQKEEF